MEAEKKEIAYYNGLAVRAVDDEEAFSELYEYFFLVSIIFYLRGSSNRLPLMKL